MIRHTLTFVGGVLVMKGMLDEGAMNEITGGVIGLVATIWGVIEKRERP